MAQPSFSKGSSPRSAVPVAVALDSPVYIDVATPTKAAPAAPQPPKSKPQALTWLHHGLSNAACTVGLMILHVVATAFSMTAFTIVVLGFVAGVTLLPLMCVGVLVFGVFWAILGPLAKVDEYLFLTRKALYTSVQDKMPTNWSHGAQDRQQL